MADMRILIGDDHTLVRQGLRKILEEQPDWEVVAQASDGREAVRLALAVQPDVAILDIGMPLLNGIDATRQIVRRLPAIAVLILSMHSEEAYITQALKAGARGYLLKDSVEEDLLKAIRSTHAGHSFFSPLIARTLLDGYARGLNSRDVEDRFELLTIRERQIYQLLAEGRGNKEIAQNLGLSLHTVETHRVRIMEKMDVHSAAELVLSAVRRGIVS
jgi:two-component system, NarL family, response regulator NreC